MQAFSGIQAEQARLESEDEEYEDLAGGDAEGEADDGQTEGNDNSFSPGRRRPYFYPLDYSGMSGYGRGD